MLYILWENHVCLPERLYFGNHLLTALLFAILIIHPAFPQEKTQDLLSDGTPISDWFHDYYKVKLEDLGEQYALTDFGVKNDSSLLQTQKSS